MNAALVVLGIALIMVPAVLAGRAPKMRASIIIRMSRSTVPSGLALILIGMLATTIPAALELVSMSGLAAFCERLIHHMVVGGRLGALAGGALSIALSAAILRGLHLARRDQARAYVEEGIGIHVHSKDSTLVVLPVDTHVAFAAPGSPPQLVVSRGTVRDLTAEQRRVVIEHEKAHIRGRHHLDLRIIAAVQSGLGWLPGIRHGMGLWREALEWHADDAAAAAIDSRECVSRTIKIWAGSGELMSLSFGGAARVGRRLAYLSTPRPKSRATAGVVWFGIGALWAGSAFLIARWLVHAHSLALGATICPL